MRHWTGLPKGAFAGVFDAGGPSALEEDASDLGIRFEPEVAPLPGRPKIGPGARHPDSVARGDLVKTDPILRFAVEVPVERQPAPSDHA